MVRYAAEKFGVRRFAAFIEPENLLSRGVARNIGFA
jgi:RimJ/RimL family protein N-acetyltransferase